MGPPRRRRRHRRPQLTRLGDNANPANAIPIGAPFVAAQWTFDAYGQVLSADHLAPHPFMHAGHKGLFFDRLDVGVADPAVPGAGLGASVGTTESPRLVPFAHSIYHNRNRAYNPQFGRFMQADPNATGMILVDDMWQFHGEPIWHVPMRLNLRAHFQDGANMFAYLGSNPWMRADPLGLWVIGPNDTFYDPNTGEYEPHPFSKLRQRRPVARPARGPGDLASVMANVGRGLGALYAATSLRTRKSLWHDDALWDILADAGVGVAGGVIGARIGGVRGNLANTFSALSWAYLNDGFITGGELGAIIAGASADALIARSLNTTFERALASTKGGGVAAANAATHTAGTFFAGYAFAAGLYAGAVEYAADSINQW